MTEDLVKVTQALVKEAGPLFGLQEQDRFSEWAALQAVLKDRSQLTTSSGAQASGLVHLLAYLHFRVHNIMGCVRHSNLLPLCPESENEALSQMQIK